MSDSEDSQIDTSKSEDSSYEDKDQIKKKKVSSYNFSACMFLLVCVFVNLKFLKRTEKSEK
jgi:hypothetical protein